MTQNSIKLSWSQEEVDEKLKSIMKNIHEACVKYGTEPDGYINYVKGANVAGFMKVANAHDGSRHRIIYTGATNFNPASVTGSRIFLRLPFPAIPILTLTLSIVTLISLSLPSYYAKADNVMNIRKIFAGLLLTLAVSSCIQDEALNVESSHR